MRSLLYIIAIIAFAGCATNPFTGKKTLALVSDETIFPMSFQQYNQFLNEHKVVQGTADAQRIETVGMNIRKAAEQYLRSVGQDQYLKDYAWEYKLVDDKTVNAWCMPGGKIVFYTGILPICKDDDGIATVMGHEVAHALLNHGQQRISAGLIQQGVGTGVAIATSGKSNETQQMAMTAYGAGSQLFGILPFSRKHETEADEVGLLLMALAGYNPEKAVPFWQRMSAQSGGQEPPEFLSTHPSSSNRIQNIEKLIPKVKAEASKLRGK